MYLMPNCIKLAELKQKSFLCSYIYKLKNKNHSNLIYKIHYSY